MMACAKETHLETMYKTWWFIRVYSNQNQFRNHV